MRLRFFILFCLCPCISWCQQKIIDSLENIVQSKTIAVRDKIIPLSELALYKKNDTLLSIKNGEQAIALAKQQNDPQYEVYAYSNMGLVYSLLGQVNKTYRFIDLTTQAIEDTSKKDAQAFGYNSIGLMKLNLGDKEGLEAIYTSLSYADRENNKLIAYNYTILANYYLADIENAEKYSKLAVEKALKSKDPHTLCYAYSIRGVRYLAEFERTKEYKLLDQALVNLKNAFEVYEQNPGYVRNSSCINIIANLLYTYQFKNELKPDSENLESVRFYLAKALAMPMEENEDFVINRRMIEIKAEMIYGNYREAEKLFLALIPIVSTYPKQFRNKYELNHQLAQLYDKMGEYQKSIQSYKIAFQYYQQYYDDKYTKIGQQQHAKFEITKKEIEFKRKQNLLYVGLGVITLLLILFIAFIINFIKHKKEEIRLLEKLKEEESKSLEIAKINAELYAHLKAEEAHRLQKEVLAKGIQVTHKNNILQHLQQNIQNTTALNKRELVNIIKTEQRLDKNFEEFENIIKKTHPEFYSRLQEHAAQKLTALDLKYCVYIFMKMPSKEMSDLLHVELKTIRMNKYRLKLKFKLTKSDNLEAFIQNII
ncbi:hypothetical protein [Flavobacterium sp. NKUCC04_CG]|uniref:hypothetical protein n=1 Tax=Flavobacterium sp. NKUCC04_CG TaxID=2842121 RepID=UPI001C5AAEA8|nr:hypothetical protein [Flavobacterium sp. NKUCC04_CG]MBW3517955.1 hypothetical protein [Flavobacterium sp. NKUCC04_CG]